MWCGFLFFFMADRRISWFSPHYWLSILVFSQATDLRIFYFSGDRLTHFANFFWWRKKKCCIFPSCKRRIFQNFPSTDWRVFSLFIYMTKHKISWLFTDSLLSIFAFSSVIDEQNLYVWLNKSMNFLEHICEFCDVYTYLFISQEL